MFLTTENQERVLTVLEKTGFLRLSQVAQLINDRSDGQYTQRIVRQLRYMQRVYMMSGDVIALPHIHDRPIDNPMLTAVDIMLDIAGRQLLAVSSAKPPAKLCFLTETRDGIGSYMIILVPKGHEAIVSAVQPDATLNQRVLIILLEELSQQQRFRLSIPHFFAVHDGQYHYIKGECNR